MTLVVTSFIGYGIGLFCGWMMKQTEDMFPKTTNKVKRNKKNEKRTYTREELTFGYSFGDGGSDTL